MKRHVLTLVLVLGTSVGASAQPTLDALRVFLGTSGSTCALRSGTGAPATGAGAVCDVYLRKDSPYTVYVKTGASTWSEIYRAGGTDVAVADGGTGLSSYTAGHLLYASGATTIAGTATPSVTSLTASSSVSSPSYTGAGAVTLTAGGSSNLTLSPPGDVIFNPTGNDLLPTTGYDLNIGALTNKFLTLHAAELWVETLVAQDTMATIGGRILVGPTTTLTADLASGATSMQVKHNQMVSGARVVLQANGQVEWIAVTSGASGSAGAYTYSITRNLDGSGANNWTAGDAVFNTGTTGNGYIDLYSVAGLLPGSTAGPTIVGNVRTGTTYSDIEPRWAVGNLNGIAGYSSDVYGAFFGSPSGAWVKVDPTNGVRLGFNSTTSAQIDASGNASFATGAINLTPAGLTVDAATGGAALAARSYAFTVPAGTMQMSGYRDSGDTVRDLYLNNTSGSASRMAISTLSATSGAATSLVSARALQGGTTQIFMQSGTSTVTVNGQTDAVSLVGATNIGLFAPYADFDSDLRVYTNNSSTTLMPYYRSDGNYSVFNSRPAANGGAFYINNDVNADLFLSYGGGNTWVSNTRFVNRPRWESGLAQLTVGAAGGASALPATPAGYLMVNYNGTNLLIPAYTP